MENFENHTVDTFSFNKEKFIVAKNTIQKAVISFVICLVLLAVVGYGIDQRVNESFIMPLGIIGMVAFLGVFFFWATIALQTNYILKVMNYRVRFGFLLGFTMFFPIGPIVLGILAVHKANKFLVSSV